VDVWTLHQYIERVISRGEKALVLNLNVHCVNLALRHAWLADFLNQAQLVFCDGDGVRLGLRILGVEPPPKITYNEWMWELAGFCAEKGFSLYFLGAKPGVADEAAQKLKARYPGLSILGASHGYFQKEGEENAGVVDTINRLKPDILVLGFGMPAQEKWLETHFRDLQVHIFLSGGAVFDYVAGRLKKAPAWMVRAHMEWLYRLGQEPRRLFKRYVIGNPLFLYRILRERIIRGRKK